MRKFLAIAAIGLLAACASPTFQMSPEQVASLSDDQICTYKNNYRNETKLEAEIARRNLNCDPYFRECLRQGNQPGTQAMDFCRDVLRENLRLRYDNYYYDHDVFGYHRHRRPYGSGVGVGVGFGF